MSFEKFNPKIISKTMARRIRFIAPIESMSGNLSGLQELLYPTNDNSAYESPEGKVNYARNYKPRYVATYRRKDGSLGFQVRTRTAVNMTPETKLAMSVLGGVGALTGAILRTAAYKAAAEAQMQVEIELGADYKSLREFLDAKIRPALVAKEDRIVINPVGGIFGNNFVFKGNSGTTALAIPDRVLLKFWSELADDPIAYKVGGITAVAHDGDTFQDIINSRYNTLNLTVASGKIKLGNQWVLVDESTYAEPTYAVSNEEEFTLTTDAPA